MLNQNKLVELEKFLNHCVDIGAFPGCNCAVMTKDEIWKKSIGYKQLIPVKEINNLDTLYDLASVSKVIVTTTCILKLMEEGTLTLKTRIKDILPEFKLESVTIKECITHTSGLPADINGYKSMACAKDLINAAMNVDFEYEKGTRVLYSDVNFILLGLVIKALKGDLDVFAKNEVFDPLEMVDSCYNPDPSKFTRCCAEELIEDRGGVIRGIVHDGKAFKLDGISGHAGVFSTIDDISHFVKMVLSDGVYNGKQFLSKRTIHLLKECFTVGLNERRTIGWVLGDKNFALGDYASDLCLFHTGFSGSSVLIDLKLGIAVVILANRVHPSRENKLILDLRNNIHNIAYQSIF